MQTIKDYQTLLTKATGKRDRIQEQLTELETINKNQIAYLSDLEQAQIFLQSVAQRTQELLRFHIKDVVQMAIDTCWPDEIEFDILFEIKRGKTEARLVFRNSFGDEVDPYDADGGGLVDISALGLVISAWSLGRYNNTIVLDQPFPNLSDDLQPLGEEIIKMLSDELGIQFIILTHRNEMVDIADRIFKIKRKKDEDGYFKSYVEVI